MKRTLATLAVASALISGNAFADGASIYSQIAMDYMHTTFKMMANDKKVVTKDKFMKMAESKASKDFATLDMDNDGVLTEGEFMSPRNPFFESIRLL